MTAEPIRPVADADDRSIRCLPWAEPSDVGSVLDDRFVDDWLPILGPTAVVMLTVAARQLTTSPTWITSDRRWAILLGVKPSRVREAVRRLERRGFVRRLGVDVEVRLTFPRAPSPSRDPEQTPTQGAHP